MLTADLFSFSNVQIDFKFHIPNASLNGLKSGFLATRRKIYF